MGVYFLVIAANEQRHGRVEQGGWTITLALHMQAARRRQPLKKNDLYHEVTCSIFNMDSVSTTCLLLITQPVGGEKLKRLSAIRY